MAEKKPPQVGATQPFSGLEPEAIRAALGRILDSQAFANAPVLRRFLQHVVEHSLSNGDGRLKEYALGVDVFDRGTSFDPRLDTIVRVQARRLRSKLSEYYQTQGRRDPVRIVIPKGAYAPEVRRAAARGAVKARQRERSGGRTPPAARTALIGREREIAEVKQLLQRVDVRLVTLTGAGGAGKTRLGLEVCAELASEYAGGLCFVSLASVTTAESALAAIARRIGLRQTAGKPLGDALSEYLQQAVRAPTLLFVDNFEHVCAAAPMLGRMLESSALLQILVTSRAVLHVAGENEYPVPPLPLPDPADLEFLPALSINPAIALFVQRASAVKPEFSLTARNAATIAQICCRLDGLPLAIELAAARTKMFPPAAVLARLDGSLDFLSRGPSDAPLRHQALRSTIDWSYELLSAPEQRLFRRLAVFRGGCTLESAEAVCNTRSDLQIAVEDGLASLLDKSLVQQIEADGEVRFIMLETIREYAFDRLLEGEEAALARKAHAAYCLVVAEEGNRQLTDANREAWLAQCEAEHDNIRAALDWLVESGDAEWGLRLVLALYAFWERREYLAEGRAWTETVLALRAAADRPWHRAKALSYAGAFATAQGDFESVPALNHAAIDIFRALGDVKGIVAMLNSLAVVERLQGNWNAAQAWLEQSLAAAREAGDRAAAAAVLSNLADVVSARGDVELARRLFEEALEGFREIGDWRGVAWSLNHLGDVARARQDFDEAGRKYDEAAAAFRDQGDRWGTARTCADLGELACERGDYGAATSMFEEALQLFLALGHRRGIATVLEGLATLFARHDDVERVLVLAGAAAALRRRIGAPPRPREQVKVDRAVEFARARDADGAQRILASAFKMPLADVVEYARVSLRASRDVRSRPLASGSRATSSFSDPPGAARH